MLSWMEGQTSFVCCLATVNSLSMASWHPVTSSICPSVRGNVPGYRGSFLTDLCVYICAYICMYVCVYIYIYIYAYIYLEGLIFLYHSSVCSLKLDYIIIKVI